MTLAISVKNLSKNYRMYSTPAERLKELLHPFGKRYSHEFTAVKDVSFDLKKGESLGLIGRNGSGKSTLLRVLCGILQPTSGEVKVVGNVSALLELGAGFNPEFTGRENVYMNGTLRGLSKKEMDKKFNAIVSFADIGEFLDQPVKTYSSGMFVRLAFSCAVNVDPDILIVDEALAVGDLSFRQKCMDRMLEFFGKKTVILVSHNLADIKRLCKKVIVLNKGKAVFIGPPEKAILEYYAILERETEFHEDEQARPKAAVKSQSSNKEGTIYLREIRTWAVDDGGRRIEGAKIMFGKPFEVELKYEIKAALNRPEFRISFNTIDKNMIVCSASSRNSGVVPDKLSGDYTVRYAFQTPLLYPREYYLNAAICDHDSGLYYYSHEDAFRFKVYYPEEAIFEDMEPGTGITHMARSFSMEKGI